MRWLALNSHPSSSGWTLCARFRRLTVVWLIGINMHRAPHDEGSDYSADEGMVFIDGCPSPLCLTPEAAMKIADGLTDAAAEALGQRRMEEIRRGMRPT